MVDTPERVRWSVSVPKETDASVRQYLAKAGLRSDQLSDFVADAVRWRLFDLNVSASRAANADKSDEEIEAAIQQALEETRKS